MKTNKKNELAKDNVGSVKNLVKSTVKTASIVAATTVATMSGANAVDLTAADIWNDASGNNQQATITNPAAGTAVGLAGFALTFATAGDGTAAGAITDGGSNDGTAMSIDVINTDNLEALTQSVASFSVDGIVRMRTLDNEAAVTLTATVTSASNVVGGNLLLTNADDAADGHLTLDINGGLAVTGTTTLTAHTGSTGADSVIIVDKAATFTGKVVLDDNTGDAILEFEQNNVADITFTGGLEGAADGEGTLQLTGTGKTVKSAVGTALKSLKEVQVDAASGEFEAAVYATLLDVNAATTLTGAGTFTTITIDGGDLTASSTLAGAIAMNGSGVDLLANGDVTGAITQNETDSTITYDAAADQTQTGALIAAADADGIVRNKNTDGTLTFSTTIGTDGNRLKEIDLDANSVTIFSGATKTDLLTQDGRITLTTAETDALDANFGAASVTIIAKTIVAGTNVFDDVGADYTVTSGATFYMPINLEDGEALIFLDGADGNGDDATVITALNVGLVDSAIIDYVATEDATANETDVTANFKTDVAAAAELSTSVNEARALKQAFVAIQTTSADEDIFEAALINSAGTSSATLDTDLAQQVAPQTDATTGSATATRAMTGSVQGIVSNRMASLRSGEALLTGMSAGDGMSLASGFIQGFGSEAVQKNQTSGAVTTYGFDADTSGVAIGIDGETSQGGTIGISASFSDIDVTGKGTGKASNSVESYTVSAYADKATDGGYIEGSVTYGINENATARVVNVAGLDRSYKGAFDSEQLSVKVGAGAPRDLGNGMFVTPYGSLTATTISTDSYIETSSTASDNLRLKVAQDDINSLIGTVGVRANMVTDKGTPSISLAINNEFGDTSVNASNTYQGGGTAFKTTSDVEALSATLGLGYAFGNDNATLNIGYEANANDDDYLSHYGTVKLVANF
jgi:hypothetical protein